MAVDAVADLKRERRRLTDRLFDRFFAGVVLAGMIASRADVDLAWVFSPTHRHPGGAQYNIFMALVGVLIYSAIASFLFAAGTFIQGRALGWRMDTPSWRAFAAGVANVAILLIDWHLGGSTVVHVAKEVLLPLLLPLFVFWLDAPLGRLARRTPA